MVAGAGSGKTTSLIKALSHLGETRGPALRRAGQQIACITYTEVAVGEITADVGATALFHISTIHSFLWNIIRSFQVDIGVWVAERIGEKIDERQAHINRPRTQAATKLRLEGEIAALQDELAAVSQVERFTYGTGSRYSEGILGHDDILKLAPACIERHELLREIVARRFPYIFVDESQDTQESIIDALRLIAREQPLCVGFFGDPMQKIYATGAGEVTPLPEWARIEKPENFRCPTSVLSVINRVREAGDGLVQTGGRTVERAGEPEPVVGTANIFILPSDDHRTAHLRHVRAWLAEQTEDELWNSDLRSGDVRLLVLVHREAAKRLGFASLYAALNDRAPLSLSEGITDGTAWPLRPFVQHLLPLIAARRAGDQFTVMSILRAASPCLRPDRLRAEPVAPLLAALEAAVEELDDLLAEGSESTAGDILRHVRESELLELDDRFRPHFQENPVDDGSSGYVNVAAFLESSVAELWSYLRYLRDESPFATHQGVKGAQFERVLVVLDEESTHKQYSYGKYLGYEPLSEKDESHIAAGEESVLDRTRRLFYVCCSRAVKDLAVVVFTANVEAARAALLASQLFPANAIRDMRTLN
ncbi:UvrD-helicase domain-containing protein [Burkholderia sp. 3C]